MASEYKGFWLELLNNDDLERRSHLWNGYIAWKLPQLINDLGEAGTPLGGWPSLNSNEMKLIEEISNRHGGHPTYDTVGYMDFTGHGFDRPVDFSGLCLVGAKFDKAIFYYDCRMSEGTKFLLNTSFLSTVFQKELLCEKVYFQTMTYFAMATFEWYAKFIEVEFECGANFSQCVFKKDATFDRSKFREIGIPDWLGLSTLADFSKVTFQGRTSFREVTFGDTANVQQKKMWTKRRAEFSDSQFKATTDFRGAIFNGVPAFFNASLHEDTDFSEVDWKRTIVEKKDASYAIRAWERLELTMSQLERPVDRHRFYRLKMRVRRQVDKPFIRALNWLFDVSCEYGWNFSRAFACWFGHWVVSGIVLLVNTGDAATSINWFNLTKATFGTAFANAHAFLGLTSTGGYLEPKRKFLEQHDQLGLLVSVSVVEAFLGPVFLFLVVLAIRNRFRLA